MLSVRMRASRLVKGADEMHISGAESIVADAQAAATAAAYVQRALEHPRGRPDRIVLTVEEIVGRPCRIPSLPVVTARCNSTVTARRIIGSVASRLGISIRALEAALRVVSSHRAMRGAALIEAVSGRRREPDGRRGVRVSRLGITGPAARSLSRGLARHKIDTVTVREAVVLASKVASCGGVIAELCVPDDPDYTTGYLASRAFGYIRIPHITRKGLPRGGRVFFIRDGSPVSECIAYLENVPVMISSASTCSGEHAIDEIISNPDR